MKKNQPKGYVLQDVVYYYMCIYYTPINEYMSVVYLNWPCPSITPIAATISSTPKRFKLPQIH